jgi:hypothetical protein
LSHRVDTTIANRLNANLNKIFIGVQPNGMGFLVDEKQALQWINKRPSNGEVLKLFSMGANLAQYPHGKPSRWIIDFSDKSLEDVSDYSEPFEHIKNHVKPERERNRELVLREKWWRFKRTNEAMRKALKSSTASYFTVPRVSKWAVFMPAPIEWLAGDKSVVVASEDFYVLGILNSQVHRTWLDAQKSTLEDRTAYTPSTCFETFPFPQTPTQKQIDTIRATAIELHEYRSTQMAKKCWGITKLYNEYFNEPASQLAKLHKTLDDLTLKAYGFSPTDDLLEVLLALNLELAEKEKGGDAIVGPWAPDKPPK